MDSIYFDLKLTEAGFRDLESRKETREKAWQVDGWSDTVHKVIVIWSRDLLAR